MPKNEKARDAHGDDTDTIIERMEAQFEHESRRPQVVVDSPGELHTYLDPNVSGVEVGGYSYLVTPAIDASQARWWHRTTHSEHIAPRVTALPAYRELTERWRAALLKQAFVVGGPDHDALPRPIVKRWIDRVPADRRQQFEIDVEYVLQRLSLLFSGRQGEIWLESFNHHLGSRPVDVLVSGATSDVLAAVESEDQGAF